MILTEKQPKYQPYHQEKLTSINILLVKKYSHLINNKQVKFTCSPLGKVFEKQIETIEDQGEKQVEALKTKAVEGKSDGKSSNCKEIYDKILEERMDEILEMSREINDSNLIYDFKGSTSSIRFTEFGGPMYTYNQLKNGDKTLQQVEKENKKINQN